MGRLALLTGAAGDLGRAAGVALAADGWDVVLSDHPSRADALEESRIDAAAHPVAVAVATFDVTDHASVEAAFADVRREHGTPTAIVANAGIQGEFAPVHRYDPAGAARVLEVNVLGVFHTIRVAANALMAAGEPGAIVAAASMAGVGGAPNMPLYSASKAAVIGLVKTAAKDLAPAGIRVNAISPAFIGPGAMWDTQVARQAATGTQYYDADHETVAAQMIAQVPLRRVGSPEEVADVVCFLAGDRSSYVTGVNIEIAGGAA